MFIKYCFHYCLLTSCFPPALFKVPGKHQNPPSWDKETECIFGKRWMSVLNKESKDSHIQACKQTANFCLTSRQRSTSCGQLVSIAFTMFSSQASGLGNRIVPEHITGTFYQTISYRSQYKTIILYAKQVNFHVLFFFLLIAIICCIIRLLNSHISDAT